MRKRARNGIPRLLSLHMNSFTAYIASHLVAARQSLRNEHGQGALEYIAIVVGLILMVAIGFQLAGVQIEQKAASFVSDVVGNAGGSN